ncbi:hypothetical protein Bca52824_083029 [Brassica carinata]|uniref:RNase H type-1 domain-containing protein n=1 Tax=Brassica carinata TaxID=52824 RepID=A0A8X7PLN5_BRACI|nr:hypothetical protein Bca52824_083029 [Brassica carinata]
MNTAAMCPRCKKEETAMHVFFQFPFAKEVWLLLPLKSPIHIAEEADFKTLVVRSREMICLPPTGIRAPVFPWICWSLWTARNKLIFEDKTVQPSEVATKGLATALEWDQAQSLDKSNSPKRTLCCFVDAVWDASSNRAGIVWLFTSELTGSLSSGARIIENVGSPLMAESLALRKGITKAMELGFLQAISSPNQLKEIYGVLQDIKSLSANFDSIVFNHISCSQNREVDLLANQVLKVHWCPSCFAVD